eukprot:6004747-Prymnesium_polylepis.2
MTRLTCSDGGWPSANRSESTGSAGESSHMFDGSPMLRAPTLEIAGSLAWLGCVAVRFALVGQTKRGVRFDDY